MTTDDITKWLHNEAMRLRIANHVSAYLMIRPRSYREVLKDKVRTLILERGKKHKSGWEE